MDDRFSERAQSAVYGNGIVRVRCIAADVDDDLELTICTSGVDKGMSEEVGDLGCKVDCVDEDVNWTKGSSG